MDNPPNDPLESEKGESKKSKKAKLRRGIGYALLIISTITWFSGFLLAPFLPFEAKTRVVTAGILIGIGEVTFYAAIPFLGKEIVYGIRKYLNPFNWFRRKKDSEVKNEEVDV